ncbi:MAG: sigma-70 family RNA polymerase sigma factor [Acidimicrobiia bacterium]
MAQAEASQGLLTIYDRALPQVYGYLLDRCGDVATAEDLTSETFLAAVAAPRPSDVSVPWLIGVARHKLVDHWRRRSRDERLLTEVAAETDNFDDDFELHADRLRTAAVLEQLGGHHRAALTLRYVDGLPVAEVADLLGRTLHATEALLVRARAAFRKAYESGDDDA